MSWYFSNCNCHWNCHLLSGKGSFDEEEEESRRSKIDIDNLEQPWSTSILKPWFWSPELEALILKPWFWSMILKHDFDRHIWRRERRPRRSHMNDIEKTFWEQTLLYCMIESLEISKLYCKEGRDVRYESLKEKVECLDRVNVPICMYVSSIMEKAIKDKYRVSIDWPPPLQTSPPPPRISSI